MVYFIAWFGQAVLIVVLNILVADCEDEELTCWRLGRPCEELVQARDTTPWPAQDACTKWRHQFHVGWILSCYCSCFKSVTFRLVPMSSSSCWESCRVLPAVENNQCFVNQVRNLAVCVYIHNIEFSWKEHKNVYYLVQCTSTFFKLTPWLLCTVHILLGAGGGGGFSGLGLISILQKWCMICY